VAQDHFMLAGVEQKNLGFLLDAALGLAKEAMAAL